MVRPPNGTAVLIIGFKLRKPATTGSASAEPEPARTMQNPQLDVSDIFALRLYVTVSPALKLCILRQPRYNSSPTSGSSLCNVDGP